MCTDHHVTQRDEVTVLDILHCMRKELIVELVRDGNNIRK